MKKNIVLALPLFLFLMITSCQPYSLTKEIELTEDLIKKVDRTQQTFLIDLVEINSRRDSMNQRLRTIQNDFNDSVGFDMQMMLTEYRGIIRNYHYFLSKIPVLEMENEEHLERLKNLRSDLLAKRFSSAEFEAIYQEEKEVIENHANDAQETLQAVVLLEPKYHRLNTKVMEIVTQISPTAKK